VFNVHAEKGLQCQNAERKVTVDEGVRADADSLDLQVSLFYPPWLLLLMDLWQSSANDAAAVQLIPDGGQYDHSYAGLPPLVV